MLSRLQEPSSRCHVSTALFVGFHVCRICSRPVCAMPDRRHGETELPVPGAMGRETGRVPPAWGGWTRRARRRRSESQPWSPGAGVANASPETMLSAQPRGGGNPAALRFLSGGRVRVRPRAALFVLIPGCFLPGGQEDPQPRFLPPRSSCPSFPLCRTRRGWLQQPRFR